MVANADRSEGSVSENLGAITAGWSSFWEEEGEGEDIEKSSRGGGVVGGCTISSFLRRRIKDWMLDVCCLHCVAKK